DAVGLLPGFAARMATAHTIAIEGPGGRRYATLDYAALRVPFPRFAVVLRADLQEYLLLGALSAGVRVEFGRRVHGCYPSGKGHRATLRGWQRRRVQRGPRGRRRAFGGACGLPAPW